MPPARRKRNPWKCDTTLTGKQGVASSRGGNNNYYLAINFNNNNNNNNNHFIPSGVGSSIVLLIPEGEGQDLFFLFLPNPASQPKDIWNIHTGKKGGVPTPSSSLSYTRRGAQQWQWLLVASSRSVATWSPKVVRS